MPRIATFTAPEKEIRPTATGTSALELAGRRINPLYQEIARNEQAKGQIAVQQYKELLWPRDILALYENREKAAKTGGFQGVRLKVAGGLDTGLSVLDKNYGKGQGHGQVSRGAGALGYALSDGGYSLSNYTDSTGSGTSTDISTETGQPVQTQDLSYLNKIQDAAGAYNGIGGTGKQESALSNAADSAAAALEGYWQQYGKTGIPTTPVDTSGNQVGYDQYGNPATDTSSSGGGFWSNLTDYVAGSSSSSDQPVASAAIPSE